LNNLRNFAVACCAEDGSELTLSDILVFWTGAEVLPPCGFESALTVQFYSQETSGAYKLRRLPSSSTCGLILWLPRDVDDPDCLWSMLVDAVKLSAGFGKI